MSERPSRPLGCIALGLPIIFILTVLQLRADLNLGEGRDWVVAIGALYLVGLMVRHLLARLAAPFAFVVLLFYPIYLLSDIGDGMTVLQFIALLVTVPGLLALAFVAFPYSVAKAHELFGHAIPCVRLSYRPPTKELLAPLAVLAYVLCWMWLGNYLLPGSSIGYAYFSSTTKIEEASFGWIVYFIPILAILTFLVVESLSQDKIWGVVCLGPLLSILDLATARSIVGLTITILVIGLVPALLTAAGGAGLRYGWVVGSATMSVACVAAESKLGVDLATPYILALAILLSALSASSYSQLPRVRPNWRKLLGTTLQAISPGHWLLGVGSRIKWLDGPGPLFD